jgi:hypothetical protein
MPQRRRLILAAGSGVLLACGAGCAGLGGPPTVRLSAQEIEALLARRFPLERRLLEVFDLTLATPRIRLLPERNRIAASLDLDARERVLGSQWAGRLDFDAALRWEAQDRSIRLTQARVQDFTLDRRAGAVRSGAERLGGALVERVIDELPVYTLDAERAQRLRAAGYVPAGVEVTARGVEVTFERVSR